MAAVLILRALATCTSVRPRSARQRISIWISSGVSVCLAFTSLTIGYSVTVVNKHFHFVQCRSVGIQRVNAGIKVLPDLKRALQKQADKEERTLSKLGEVLLRWAYEQLQIAGDSQILKEWEAKPRQISIAKIIREVRERKLREEEEQAATLLNQEADSEAVPKARAVGRRRTKSPG